MADLYAVLFDFGGVFTASPFHVLEQAAVELGVSPELVLATCFGGYDQDTDHPWHRLERGECTVEEALAGIAALAAESGYDIDPMAVLSRGMGGGKVLRDDVVELVREIRALGLRTAVVTNNIREFSAGWRALLPVDELFDVVVDSCEEGVRKPDPRIYERALERLGGIAPERAVFIDDASGNVRAAQALGMHAVLVAPDPTEAIVQLRQLVGLAAAS